MNKTTLTSLSIACPRDPHSRYLVESLGLAVSGEARKQGWRSSVHWVGQQLIVRIQNGDPGHVRIYLRIFEEQAQRKGWTLAFSETTAPGELLPNKPGQIEWGRVTREKLTREFLEQLPEGVFLTSNLLDNDRPAFAEQIIGSDRSLLWAKAKRCGAAHRLCRLLWSEEDFRAACQPSLVERLRETRAPGLRST